MKFVYKYLCILHLQVEIERKRISVQNMKKSFMENFISCKMCFALNAFLANVPLCLNVFQYLYALKIKATIGTNQVSCPYHQRSKYL